MILKGIKYRIYPTEEQEQFLYQEVGNQRFVWNRFLAKQISLYKRTGKFKFHFDMNRYLTGFKQDYDFLYLGSSIAIQATLKDLDQAVRNCYRYGFGFPKFKRRGISDSYRIPQKFTIGRSSITIPKLGQVRINKNQSLGGTPRNITIKREGKKWYCAVCVKFKPKKLKKTGKSIGIDLGTVRLATGSKGQVKKSFKEVIHVKKITGKIKTTQRKLERRDKGSSSWTKAKSSLQKLHLKLKNKRNDHLQKFSTMLVKKYDVIVVEDLKTKNMTKSSKGTIKKPGKMVKQKSGLNRTILMEGWSYLLNMLEYKCGWYGKQLIRVNPMFTSQICSSCGFKSKKNRKSQSKFLCNKCGNQINADHNAAINILRRGLTTKLSCPCRA